MISAASSRWGPWRSMPTFRHIRERRLERTSAGSSSVRGRDEVLGFTGDELAGVLTGAFAEDEGFDEGVGGEAVGAVESGVRNLADGVEILDGGQSEEVGDDAADHVMSRRVDGDRLLGGVNVERDAHL